MNKKYILLSIVLILFLSLVIKPEMVFSFDSLVDTEQINKIETLEGIDHYKHIQFAIIKDTFSPSLIFNLTSLGFFEINCHITPNEITLCTELNHSPPTIIS